MSHNLKRFLSYYKPYKGIFTAVLIAALLSSGVALLIPLCTRYITGALTGLNPQQAVRHILVAGGLMAALVVLHTALDAFMDYRGHIMGARMERDIRSALFAHYMRFSFRFYDNRKVGELMSRLTGDLQNLAEFYHHGPEDLLYFTFRFTGAFFIMFTISPSIAILVTLFIPPMLLFTLLVGGKMRKACKKSFAQIASVNSTVEDSLSGIRVVKSFGAENRETEKFSKINQLFFLSRKSIYKYESILYQGMSFLIHMITVAVVVFGALGISGGTLSLPDLIAFILYVGYVTDPITHLVHMIGQFQEGFASFERFAELMDTTPDILDDPKALPLTAPKGTVTFQNVSFSYGEALHPVLKDVSFTVKKGESVALVGHSGVGKSTFCALISRFYDVSDGAILVDHKDVRSLTQHSLHKAIAVVEQDIYLFSGTVLENIGYGTDNPTQAAVIAAAKNAGAHDFITALPQGYHTDIGVKGVKLSGGQKQRISIARAFLKNPAILIFDEATSALDRESEQLVQDSLWRLTQGRTTFIIAHRLSTIQNCQRILLIENGGIAEEGTHESLIEKGGTYAKLYQFQ